MVQQLIHPTNPGTPVRLELFGAVLFALREVLVEQGRGGRVEPTDLGAVVARARQLPAHVVRQRLGKVHEYDERGEGANQGSE